MNKTEIGIVYFDVGDVLARHQGGLNALSEMFRVSLPEITKELQVLGIQGNSGKIATQTIWDSLTITFNYQGQNVNFLDFWLDFLKPISEAHDLLFDISKVVSIGLLTNLFPGMYAELLRRGDIPNAPYLTSVVSCNVKVAKPDQGIFKIAEDRINISPDRILFIDDNAENIAVANRRHWHTVHFNPNELTDSINEARTILRI
jgi:FMN phosphatase YigB (HAD superfamily)